jgi:peptidyl-prolyl cis-trans isomerase SurA
MAPIFGVLVNDVRRRCRSLGAVVVLAALLIPAETGRAQAQNVNGEPITQLDIDQRSKLRQTMARNHQAPSRQEVLDELTNEKEKLSEAKRRGIDPSDSDVDSAIALGAKQLHMSTDQFFQLLTKTGVTEMAYKTFVRAELVRRALGQ